MYVKFVLTCSVFAGPVTFHEGFQFNARLTLKLFRNATGICFMTKILTPGFYVDSTLIFGPLLFNGTGSMIAI